MKTTILLLLLLLHLTVQAAVPVGGVRINSDSTGTNTRSAAVTITLQTNVNTGILNATNSIRVGQAGEAGVIDIVSTNSTYTVTITVDANGNLVVKYGTTNMLTVANGATAAYSGTGTNYLADNGIFGNPIVNATNLAYLQNVRLAHSALTADNNTTNFHADFAADAYRTITAAADVNFQQSTNRAAVESMVIFISPSGGNRNFTVNSDWKKLNTFNTVITNGTVGVLSLTVKGTAETDVYAAYAVTQ